MRKATEFVLLPGNRRIMREEYEKFLVEFEAAIRNERCLCGAAKIGEWTAGVHHNRHRCARVITRFPNGH